MFDFDALREIFATIDKNRLRSVLTAFSVAWGIFMLIILLGAGQGLQNAVTANFESDATNSVWISGGATSKDYKGIKAGRHINLKNSDYSETVRLNAGAVETHSAVVNIWTTREIAYGKEMVNYNIYGVHHGMTEIEQAAVTDGRFINHLDIEQHRKAAVISEKVQSELFKDKKATGEYITVNSVPFKVVGIFLDANPRENECIYIPFTTAQRTFGLVPTMLPVSDSRPPGSKDTGNSPRTDTGKQSNKNRKNSR